MNITSLTSASTSSTANSLINSQTSAQASTALSPIAAALQKADQRIQSEVDATSSRLSSLGTLKSAVSNIQIAAQALHHLPANVPDANVKTAANDFLLVFNNTIQTAKTTAATLSPGSAATSSLAATANRAATDLRRAVNPNSSTMDALKKIGFSLQTDGTLSLDTSKFDAAQKADPAGVLNTMSKLGQQVDTAATQELATGGNMGLSLTALNQRASTLKAQQAALSKAEQAANTSASASTSSTQGTGTAWSANYGAGAYLSSLWS
jgi:flagellar hook-associated protein 2